MPRLTEDISEAATCIGSGRYTAAVFHLMRVMEFGVAKLAKALNATIDTDQAWGAIHVQMHAHIKSLPSKNARQKARKAELAEIAGYLDHVRIAWRNQTMHPKRTYTEEEAEHLFSNVKTFMQAIAKRRVRAK
jgi:HEPN domain-containing protein